MRCFQSEYGDDWTVVHDFPIWRWLVTSYTRRELTFKSDKLVAVQGIATEFGKSSNKQYWYGLWLEDLPEDLFWHGQGRLQRDVGNDIPSWSWASTTGGILFKSFEEPIRSCRYISKDVATPGQLTIMGLIKEVEELRGPVECQAFSIENLQRMDFAGELHDEYKSGSIRVEPTFLLLQDSEKAGWGVFDEFDRPPGPIWCLALLKQPVWAWYNSAERYFYWVLLLQKSHSKNAYVRVGWGLILKTSWCESTVEQRINLV